MDLLVVQPPVLVQEHTGVANVFTGIEVAQKNTGKYNVDKKGNPQKREFKDELATVCP